MREQFLMRSTTMDEIESSVNKMLRTSTYKAVAEKCGKFSFVDSETGKVAKDIWAEKLPSEFRLFRMKWMENGHEWFI